MEDWLKALDFSFQMVAKLSAIFIGWDWLAGDDEVPNLRPFTEEGESLMRTIEKYERNRKDRARGCWRKLDH